MNDRERFLFDRIIIFLYKNMGDDILRDLRPGINYYRSLEEKLHRANSEINELYAELSRLRSNKRDNCILDISKGLECKKCRNSPNCPNWDPEPESIVSEDSNSLVEKLEKPVEGVEGVKEGFFRKLFGR